MSHLENGMFHTKESIISTHFGFTEALLEDPGQDQDRVEINAQEDLEASDTRKKKDGEES